MSDLIATLRLRSSEPGRPPQRWAYVAVGVVVFLLVSIFATLVMSTYSKISPIDEMQHLDSTIKASNGQWYLAPGERIGPETMKIIACQGYDGKYQRKEGTPPCNSTTFSPEDFPQRGINTAAGRVNVFYPVTGYLAKAIDAVTGVGMLTAARLVSVLFWSLGAALLALLAARLSRSALIGASAGVAIGLLGSGLWIAVTINPDSWSLLVGSLMVGATLAMPRWKPWQVGVGIFAILLMATLVKANFYVLAAIPFFMAIPWFFDAKRRKSALAVLGACIVSGIAFIYFSLPKGTASAADTAPMAEDLKISKKNPWDFTEMFGGILNGIAPNRPGGIVEVLSNPLITAATSVVIAAMFAGVVIGLIQAPRRSQHFRWAAVTALTALSAPILAFVGMIAIGVFFRYPERYSLVILPALAITWVQIQPRRPAIYAAVAAIGIGALSWSLVAWAT